MPSSSLNPPTPGRFSRSTSGKAGKWVHEVPLRKRIMIHKIERKVSTKNHKTKAGIGDAVYPTNRNSRYIGSRDFLITLLKAEARSPFRDANKRSAPLLGPVHQPIYTYCLKPGLDGNALMTPRFSNLLISSPSRLLSSQGIRSGEAY